MHDECLGAALCHRADEVANKGVVLAAINADAMLDCNGYANGILHGAYAVAHEFGLGHEAGAEGAVLHALAGTAAIQIDFVITPFLGQTRAVCQRRWVRTTELQGNRMLLVVEAQMARQIAMQRGRRSLGNHLGV